MCFFVGPDTDQVHKFDRQETSGPDWHLDLYWSLDVGRLELYCHPMKVEGLRSPYEKVGGLYHFARMLDKVRLYQAGKLPAEYHPNFGLSVGLDGHLCGFLGVDFAAVCERVRQGETDDQVAECCFQRGLRPNKIQMRVWNEFARKFGWDDIATKFMTRVKNEEGLEHRTDIVTSFDLIDLREGREQERPGGD